MNEQIAEQVRSESSGLSEDEVQTRIQEEQRAYASDRHVRNDDGSERYANLNAQLARFHANDRRMRAYDDSVRRREQERRDRRRDGKGADAGARKLINVFTGGLFGGEKKK